MNQDCLGKEFKLFRCVMGAFPEQSRRRVGVGGNTNRGCLGREIKLFICFVELFTKERCGNRKRG